MSEHLLIILLKTLNYVTKDQHGSSHVKEEVDSCGPGPSMKKSLPKKKSDSKTRNSNLEVGPKTLKRRSSRLALIKKSVREEVDSSSSRRPKKRAVALFKIAPSNK